VKWLVLFLTLATFMSGSALGQTPRRALDTGTIEDLKGQTKIFVSSTPRDQSLAKKVSATIQKKLPGITLVNSMSEAEIWIRVYTLNSYWTDRTPPDLNRAPRLGEDGQTMPGDGRTRMGSEQVMSLHGFVTVIQRPEPPKLVIYFSKKGGTKSSMADKFANEFVRAYQKATAGP